MAKEIRLLGFNFTKIEAMKDPGFNGKLELQNNMVVSSVEKHKLELVKEDALKINFVFTISYGKLGKVELTGTLFLLVDSKILKEAVKSWEDKKLPDELRLSVLNIILQKSSLRALQLEEDLGLPTHISLPRIQPSAEKKE